MEFLLEETLQKLAHVHLVIVMLQWLHQQQVCTRLPTILALTFRQETWHGHFITITISACACFGPAVVPARGHFISMDVSIQGLFSMRTFWLNEFLAPWMLRHWILWHLCYCAVMSMYSNVSVSKHSLPKNPCAEKSLCQKVLVPKCPRRQNVHVPEYLQGRNMHVWKCPSYEISLPKCLWPKC